MSASRLRATPRGDDRGFASAALLAVLALVGLFSLAFADAAAVLVARNRAQAAADAGALAAASARWPYGEPSDPHAAAREVVEAAAAELTSCECPDDAMRCTVEVGVRARIRLLRVAPRSVTAAATARADPAILFEG